MKVVQERGVLVLQAARDLDLHEKAPRKWVHELTADPGSAIFVHGVMRSEQQESDRISKKLRVVSGSNPPATDCDLSPTICQCLL